MPRWKRKGKKKTSRTFKLLQAAAQVLSASLHRASLWFADIHNRGLGWSGGDAGCGGAWCGSSQALVIESRVLDFGQAGRVRDDGDRGAAWGLAMLQVLLEFWTMARAGGQHFVITSLAAGSTSGPFLFYQPRWASSTHRHGAVLFGRGKRGVERIRVGCWPARRRVMLSIRQFPFFSAENDFFSDSHYFIPGHLCCLSGAAW